MEFGENKPMKVIWLCHFSNNQIQFRLGLKKQIGEFAPWISLGIKEAIKRKDIELHVISPHRWLSKSIDIKQDNIQYHFFNAGVPFTGRHWPAKLRLDAMTNFYFNKKKIYKIVSSIKPDLIHLHGAENAYYASSILNLHKEYPCLVTIQGFVSHSMVLKQSRQIKKRIDVERRIFSELSHFGVRNQEMIQTISKYNSSASFHWHEYFLNNKIDRQHLKNEKKYDLIFFARINKNKGVEDLIKITGELKKKIPSIEVAIIGRVTASYLSYLQKLCKERDCIDNVFFLGFLPLQEDVYKILYQSKICVLPTYNDIIPGTIIESMLREVPVVAYRTGGIPEINEDENRIELVHQGDWKSMAYKINKLLLNKNLRDELAQKAYHYAQSRWSNEQAMSSLIQIYKKLV